DGEVCSWSSRAAYGHGQKLKGGRSIGEIYSEAFSYPVPYKLWDEVKKGAPWPPEYRTRLTVKEATAGTMWTVEMGRARAGQDVEPEKDSSRGNNSSVDDKRAALSNNVSSPETPSGDRTAEP